MRAIGGWETAVSTIVLVVLVFGFAGCESPSQESQPRSYVYSSPTDFRFLTMTASSASSSGNDAYNGSELDAWYDVPLSAGVTPIDPNIVQNNVDGTQSGSVLRLKLGNVVPLSGTYVTGGLELSQVERSGLQQTHHWYAVTQSSYTRLLKSFTLSVQIRLKLLALDTLLSALPADSDIKQLQMRVQGAHSTVLFLQEAWNDVQHAPKAQRCTQFQDRILPFYPVSDTLFSLTPADKTALANEIGDIEHSWSLSRQNVLPRSGNFWLLSEQDINQGTSAARQVLTTLGKEYVTDEPKMAKYQQEYKSLVSVIGLAKQSCHL